MWWTILIILYFLIGTYVSASFGACAQFRAPPQERVGRIHKLIAVVFGLCWIVLIPYLIVWTAGLVKNRKDYIILINGEVLCRKCSRKFPKKELLNLDEFYYKLPICSRCKEEGK